MKTEDLGNGWHINLHEDGSATICNCDKGQRIDLPKASLDTLKNIIRLTNKLP